MLFLSFMPIASRNKIIGAFLGTVVEYYDYSLYLFAAHIIMQKFFPKADDVASLMRFYAVYAGGYLSKPIGALLFGRIGDRYGRTIALSITVVGMAFPTLCIGLLPEYAAIGIWSTIVLIFCRFIQGIFAGGEYDGAAIYVIEHLGSKRQFAASAIMRCTSAFGVLMATALVTLCSSSLFPAWGWRIPFLLSLPLAVVTFQLRKNFEETPVFAKVQDHQDEVRSLSRVVKTQWRTILMVIGLTGASGVNYQIAIAFMPHYLSIVLPQIIWSKSLFFVLIVLLFILFMFIAGLVADKVGHIVVLKAGLWGTLLGILLCIVAISYQLPVLAFIGSCVLTSCSAPFTALVHGICIRAFPVNERYRAVSLGHTIGSMFVSGTASYICLSSMYLFDCKVFPMLYFGGFAILFYSTAKLFAKARTTWNI